MKRWVFYSVFSGTGIILYGDPPITEDTLLRAARTHSQAYTLSGEPGDGNKFRLQLIPSHDEVELSQDFTYRAASAEKMVPA